MTATCTDRKRRKSPTLSEKLASALLTMKKVDDSGAVVPIIGFEEAKTLTAKQIISRFEFDHYPIPYAQGGPNEPWNLEPREKQEHREKTASRDIPQIAKTKRISAAHQEFVRRILAKGSDNEGAVAKTRPKRKIRSRPFMKRVKKTGGRIDR